MNINVLLLEADAVFRKDLTLLLRKEGYFVHGAATGAEAYVCLANHPIDVVVAELHLPDIEHEAAFVAAVRCKQPTPVLFIQTSHATVASVIAALNARAAAYLLKPYPSEVLLDLIAQELAERQRQYQQQLVLQTIAAEVAQLHESKERRSANQPTSLRDIIQVGHLRVDRSQHRVFFQDELVATTTTQYKILCRLAERLGHTISGAEIVLHTHGLHIRNEEALLLLKTHIRNLRRKIPSSYLVNIRGFGYQLSEPTE